MKRPITALLGGAAFSGLVIGMFYTTKALRYESNFNHKDAAFLLGAGPLVNLAVEYAPDIPRYLLGRNSRDGDKR